MIRQLKLLWLRGRLDNAVQELVHFQASDAVDSASLVNTMIHIERMRRLIGEIE